MGFYFITVYLKTCASEYLRRSAFAAPSCVSDTSRSSEPVNKSCNLESRVYISQLLARHISLQHISMFLYCRASSNRQDRTLISINNKYQQRMWLTCLKTASLWAKNPIWPTAREASQWPSLFAECAKSQVSWNVHSLEPCHNTTLAMITLYLECLGWLCKCVYY